MHDAVWRRLRLHVYRPAFDPGLHESVETRQRLVDSDVFLQLPGGKIRQAQPGALLLTQFRSPLSLETA
ncbi:hypothetical protein ASC65_07740 [Brevundimonas sp. Root1279]|nr:hypothetical protein ASC65_07740 [Brevundimonas sp. Root1279]